MLWNALRGSQLDELKFRRQVPIGPFVVDFACDDHRLIVEVDGDVHDTQREADAERQKYLEGQGFRVLRVTARDVERCLPMVLARIQAATSETGESAEGLRR